MKADTIEAISKLAWPVLAAVVLIFIWPTLRGIIRSRGFTIKFADLEVTVEKASDQLLKSVTDLQDKVALLMSRDAQQPPLPVGAPARVAAAPAVPVGVKPRTVLWVDDHPENNAIEARRLQGDGIDVETVKSTAQALEALKKNHTIDAVITDMGRREGVFLVSEAGIRLVETMRKEGHNQPVFIYSSAKSVHELRDRAEKAGAALLTSSPVELFTGLRQARQ